MSEEWCFWLVKIYSGWIVGMFGVAYKNPHFYINWLDKRNNLLLSILVMLSFGGLATEYMSKRQVLSIDGISVDQIRHITQLFDNIQLLWFVVLTASAIVFVLSFLSLELALRIKRKEGA